MSGPQKKVERADLERRMCTRELYNMGITSTKQEAGLVSGGKGWFLLVQGRKDLFRLVSGWEGLVSAGFTVGRTGFGWFRVGRTGFGWFRLIPLFSNYQKLIHVVCVGTQHVFLNIPAVPVDTQDVCAGKLDVAVSIQLKRLCLRT